MHLLLIDDHQLFRCGLATALRTMGKQTTISEAESIAAAKAAIEPTHREIDLILLDQRLPDGEGIEFLVYLQQHYPLIPVAILSGEENTRLMKQALESGALGYIPKSTDTAVILGAIQLMLSGGTYIPPKLMPALLSGDSARPEQSGQLTKRQQEVMALIIKGLANKEIAWQLKISEGTVKAHTTVILKSRGLYSRKQLIATG